MPNTFNVGDLEVIVVSDGSIKFPATGYFAGTTAEQWQPHARWMDHEGNLDFTYSCFIVRSGDKRVLIDTGVGPVETGPFKGGALLADMAAAGVKPADIDAVFLTHYHLDHCGTAAVDTGSGIAPAFPNATYHWTSTEHDVWHGQADTPFSRKDILGALASRYEARDGGSSVAPGVDVIALPGHTPGHAGIVLSSGDQRAFILGDAISCPAQLEEPEWSGMGDVDKELARKSQEAVLREAESTGALLGAAHFPGLTFGRVLRGEGKRYWQAV
jgi:glyoxylase-like metal-dependent hydrolase (beta-lactamase superfamily II)